MEEFSNEKFNGCFYVKKKKSSEKIGGFLILLKN
jgi:hypothetical protein